MALNYAIDFMVFAVNFEQKSRLADEKAVFEGVRRGDLPLLVRLNKLGRAEQAPLLCSVPQRVLRPGRHH